MVHGWAVVNSNKKILVNTVHMTRRGAIINYLISEQGMFISMAMSDSRIEELWGGRWDSYAFVHEVTIELDVAGRKDQ
jgi:hypothetical protein